MYFLAIVAKDDLVRGNIVPSYILCKSKGDSENRSPFRVYRANTKLSGATRALVKTFIGQDLLIDFLSHYRTRDHMHKARYHHKASTQKYYPEGALFWFPCDEYGEQNDAAIFIKTVPDPNIQGSDDGWQRLKEALKVKPTTVELLTNPGLALPLPQSHIKPNVAQPHRGKNNKD